MSPRRFPDGYAFTCACGKKVAEGAPRYKDGRRGMCVECGAKEIAAQYAQAKPPPPPTPPTPAPAAPKAPVAPIPPPVKEKQPLLNPTGTPKSLRLGITLALPGYSAIRVDYEEAPKEGEGAAELGDRVHAILWAHARREAAAVVAAGRDIEAFLARQAHEEAGEARG